MQFKLGAKVYSPDRRHVGTVDHIVIDPATKEVTHLVVRKGLFTVKDKVIPASVVQPLGDDGLVLQQVESTLDGFPDFEESQYTPTEGVEWSETRHSSSRVNGTGVYTAGYNASGASIVAEPHPTENNLSKTRNIPVDTVALKIGARVITSDNQQAGSVERIITGADDDHATHVMIAQGLLMKSRKVIPVHWINQVMEDEISLTIDAFYLDSLPNYEPEMQT